MVRNGMPCRSIVYWEMVMLWREPPRRNPFRLDDIFLPFDRLGWFFPPCSVEKSFDYGPSIIDLLRVLPTNLCSSHLSRALCSSQFHLIHLLPRIVSGVHASKKHRLWGKELVGGFNPLRPPRFVRFSHPISEVGILCGSVLSRGNHLFLSGGCSPDTWGKILPESNGENTTTFCGSRRMTWWYITRLWKIYCSWVRLNRSRRSWDSIC